MNDHEKIQFLESEITEKNDLIRRATESLNGLAKLGEEKNREINRLKTRNTELAQLGREGMDAALDVLKHFAGEPVPDSIKKFYSKAQKKFRGLS